MSAAPLPADLFGSSRTSQRDIEEPSEASTSSNVLPFAALGACEGGKGGSRAIAVPAPPPSPPSGAPIATVAGGGGSDIYRPAPASNPVLTRLRDAHLYRVQVGDGRHEIICPWAVEHAESSANTFYVEPAEHSPVGRFECDGCRQRGRHIESLLDQLGVDPSAARCKPVVRIEKGEFHRIADTAEEVLANSGDYYQAGGAIVRLRVDPFTGDIATENLTEQAATIALSAAADWETYDGRSKAWSRADVPQRVVSALMKKGDYRHLRPLSGIARQPHFRSGGGELVTQPGYDARSGVFAAFERDSYRLPELTKANALAALDELDSLIGEYHFATPSDRSAALSAMLAATIRPSLRLCPAFSISGSRPGSGKSYLASVIAQFGGPGGARNISYPTSSEEASKLVLSVMMTSPAAICFDDMTTDGIAYGAINSLLTSDAISGRVLGASKMASAKTASLIMGTGNNIKPQRDMARRVVTIYLSPRVETITSLRYEGQPLKAVERERERYVTYALTIIAAYVAAGSPVVDVPSIASFDDWSTLCRQSLIWLGQPDPARSLIEQVNDDPDMQVFGDLLVSWYDRFGDRPTMVRTVLDRSNDDAELRNALMELPVSERGIVNPSKFGRHLARHANRIIGGYELRQSPNGERNAWMVVATDDALTQRVASGQAEGSWAGIGTRDGGPSPNACAPGEIF